MPKRKLRIVRDHPLLGICEYCNMQFSSGLMLIEQAKDDIQERFNVPVCGRPFPPDVRPSMSLAFADHLRKAHEPGQMSEDVNQATARRVRVRTKLEDW
jgi:hypothetical protein